MFGKRLVRLYNLIATFSLILINEFYYDDASTFSQSGKTLGECQLMSFRICKILQKEIINELFETYKITPTKID